MVYTDDDCRVPGCDGWRYAHGLCRRCYQAWRRGDPSPHWEPYDGPRCAAPGCERFAHKRGLCETHYSRLREHGSVEVVRPFTARCVCGVEECDQPVKALGLCHAHYMRRWRGRKVPTA